MSLHRICVLEVFACGDPPVQGAKISSGFQNHPSFVGKETLPKENLDILKCMA